MHTLKAEKSGRLKQTYYLVSSKRSEGFFISVLSYPIIHSSIDKQIFRNFSHVENQSSHALKNVASALEIHYYSFITDVSGDTSNFELATTKDVILYHE